MEPQLAFGCVVVAYLVGGIPFGLLIARYGKGVDIRTVGSGNIGATNVARALGFRWGLGVLLLDAGKGALPVLLCSWVLPVESEWLVPARVGSGMAAILGHVYPIWLRFQGGKGVATAFGVILVLAPWATLAAIVAFFVVVFCGRYVALASISAAVAFSATYFAMLDGGPFTAGNWSGSAFAMAVPVLITIRHRGNLSRLWAGTEPRFRFGGEGRSIEPAPGREESGAEGERMPTESATSTDEAGAKSEENPA